MNRALAIEFTRVSEAAALAAARWTGRGNKNKADDAAVKAMRYMLNNTQLNGTIVIGEGEMDEAPMLYIGEKVGLGSDSMVDIAVDPIDGTRMVSCGQSGSIAVIAAAKKGSMLHAPDMYMHKIAVGHEAKGLIDIDLSLEENIRIVAKAKNKNLKDLVIIMLDKPRHKKDFEIVYSLGCKLITQTDGDVAMAVLAAMPDSEVDILWGSGGAPEGIIAAAAVRSLGGDMQGRLVAIDDLLGASEGNLLAGKIERERCISMGTEVNKKLFLEDMVKDDNLIFSCTGITDGDLVSGVKFKNGVAYTDTLLIRGSSRTIRRIYSTHNLTRKDDFIKDLLNEF